jgi:hypothetical protein
MKQVWYSDSWNVCGLRRSAPSCAARCSIFPCDQEAATGRASGRTIPPCDSISREVAVRRVGFIFQFYLTQFGAYFENPSLSAVLAGKRT